ncbi:TetR-like C-terminal domain-containing protein, partial [Nocardia gipuzkoensis]
VDAALAAGPADPAQGVRVLGRAVREWALAEPARYGLLFGTPVPGYEAPADQTNAPGIRVIGALLGVIEKAYAANILTIPEPVPVIGQPLAGDFAAVRAEFGFAVPDWLLARGISVWTGLFGAVSFDVFDMYGQDSFADRGDLFERHLDNLGVILGLPAEPRG